LFLLPCWLSLAGCANFWDDVTGGNFDVKNMFVTPNPLIVLQSSTDGNKRAQALRSLREPLQVGGTQKEQDLHVQILTAAATTDKQPLCRLAAIQALGQYKDPRAVDALKEAYLKPKPFAAEINTIINQQALASLGQTKSPEARELLVLVAREPPSAQDSNEVEKQQRTDLRLTAVRALANFSHYEVTETLVKMLKTEQDVALRDRAHESLEVVTGKKLPADAQEWDQLLHPPTFAADAVAQDPGKKWNFLGWR
jgi:HEAT repeat protein